jgi:hypothetical protein
MMRLIFIGAAGVSVNGTSPADITLLEAKLGELDRLHDAVVGNSTAAEDLEVDLGPLEGIVLDMAISLYLDAPEGERFEREKFVGRIVSQYSTPLCDAVFSRRSGFLRADVLTAQARLLEERRQELAAAEAELVAIRAEAAGTETARALVTSKFESVVRRFGGVRSLIMDIKSRREAAKSQPVKNFKALEEKLTDLVQHLADCAEDEIPAAQAAVLVFIGAQRAKGMSALSAWQMCRRAYRLHMERPEIPAESQRLRELGESLKAKIAETERIVSALSEAIHTAQRAQELLNRISIAAEPLRHRVWESATTVV